MAPAPILVVEHDHDSRMLLVTVLEMRGYDVIAARNGREGLRLAREHQPRLILLDLMMPVMGGEEFRREQLAAGEMRDIPVVVISAQHGASDVAKRMNAAACLPKPYDLDELGDVVSRHCR